MLRTLLRALTERAAARRVRGHPGVEIHPTAKVNCARIALRPNCRLRIGAGSIIEGELVFERDGAAISIGANTFVGASTVIAAKEVVIGDDVLVAWGATIVDHDSHSIRWGERCSDVRDWYRGAKNWEHVTVRPVRVGDRCWVGFNAIILRGVSLGDEAVVGAGSVVTKSAPPRAVCAGNPARVIRVLEASQAPLPER